METFLESRLLDDIPYSLVKQLSKFVRQRQLEKAPFSRGAAFVDTAMRKHAAWLDLQDIPEIIVRSVSVSRAGLGLGGCGGSSVRKEISGGGGVSPPTPVKKATQRLAMTSSVFGSNLNSNYSSSSRVLRRPPSGDDIFVMDDHEPQATTSTATLDVPQMSLPMPTSMNIAPQASPPVWKAHGVPRYISFFVIIRLLAQCGFQS